MSETGPPQREIIDPHHHLWTIEDNGGAAGEYLLDDLLGDTAEVDHVRQTVFVECGAQYRTTGPEHLRPVGETEFAASVAAASDSAGGTCIAGIVGFADLTLPVELLDEALDAHVDAAGGRFRGIRDALSCAPPDVPLLIPGRAPPGKSTDPDFRRGVTHLGDRGLTYDTWHYHMQNAEFLDLARAIPGTTMVLDHFGTPIGVGDWHGRHDEIFEPWKEDIAELARCPNVIAKLGGLAMPDNGYEWHLDPERRPDVSTFVDAQQRWYRHAIECFGPERCMFESNFPVDKFSVDYRVIWAAFEVMAAECTPDEQDMLFAGTARRVYGL